MHRRQILALVLTVATLAVAGCDDDSGPSSPSAARSSFQGVWAITAWTRDTTGCAGPGESILDSEQDRFLLVQGCSFSLPGLASGSYLNATGCETEEACDDERCKDNEIRFGGWTFEDGDDDSGWRGGSPSAYAMGDAETCDGEVRDFILRRDGDGLVLEERITRVTGLARDAEGHCDADAAREAAAGQPCSELERMVLLLPEQQQ